MRSLRISLGRGELRGNSGGEAVSLAVDARIFIHPTGFAATCAMVTTSLLPIFSDDTLLLTQAALSGLRRIYRSGFEYRRAGVMHLFKWWDKAAEIKTSAQYNVIAEMAILAASQNLWLMERSQF